MIAALLALLLQATPALPDGCNLGPTTIECPTTTVIPDLTTSLTSYDLGLANKSYWSIPLASAGEWNCGTGDCTAMTRYYIDSTEIGHFVIDFGGSTNDADGWGIRRSNDGRVVMNDGGVAASCDGPKAVPLNTWVSHGFRWDGTADEVEVYIDNVSSTCSLRAMGNINAGGTTTTLAYMSDGSFGGGGSVIGGKATLIAFDDVAYSDAQWTIFDTLVSRCTDFVAYGLPEPKVCHDFDNDGAPTFGTVTFTNNNEVGFESPGWDGS